MSSDPDFDPVRLLSELNAAKVDYIVIGAVAGRLFGSPLLTGDLDICYSRERRNLEALALVLQKLGATLRGADPGLPFRLDARTLAAGDSFTFTTEAGDFDILGTPSGTTGYEDLARTAEPFEIEGLTVRAASLNDLIRMKRAAGRPKDLLHVEILGALRDEIDRGGRGR